MIEEITIENLGVIRATRIPLAEGLTVITGETGAGKTMILTGLGLLMGGRAEPASVRPGARTAAVEGRIQLAGRDEAVARVDEAGGEIDEDGTVVILRTVAAEGRSRAHLGGRSVPQAVLGDLASDLVTVHGQSDQLRLRTPAHQRVALDAFAGPTHAPLLARYRDAWTERTTIVAEMDELVTKRSERAREAELLRLGLAEIERVDPQPGEDVELAALVVRLGSAEELREAAQVAHEALAGEDEPLSSATATVSRARRALENAAETDSSLAPLIERIADLGYRLADVAIEVSRYVDGLQTDPAGLEISHARIAELGALTRSYGATIDEVLVWASEAGLRLLALDDDGEHLRALSLRRDELDQVITELADQISTSRREAADRLAAAVTQELTGLAMADARLVVNVDAGEPGPYGIDVVTFLLVPHVGSPARPLGKGASGGELSRVMLALEVTLATANSAGAALPTFVFDEVDAGVGGRAATEVGRRLATLAQRAQVIVVTHLAQVAAFGDGHLVVTKSGDGAGATVTGVEQVSGEGRIRELARMLSGQDGSVTARRHAEELLDSSVVGR